MRTRSNNYYYKLQAYLDQCRLLYRTIVILCDKISRGAEDTVSEEQYLSSAIPLHIFIASKYMNLKDIHIASEITDLGGRYVRKNDFLNSWKDKEGLELSDGCYSVVLSFFYNLRELQKQKGLKMNKKDFDWFFEAFWKYHTVQKKNKKLLKGMPGVTSKNFVTHPNYHL